MKILNEKLGPATNSSTVHCVMFDGGEDYAAITATHPDQRDTVAAAFTALRRIGGLISGRMDCDEVEALTIAEILSAVPGCEVA